MIRQNIFCFYLFSAELFCVISHFPEELYRNFVFMIKLIIFATAFLENSETIIQLYCGVEQLAARRAHNPKVVGSNPTPATETG